MRCTVGRHPLGPRHAHERNTGWHKLTDAALQTHANVVGPRKGNKVIHVNVANISGPPIKDRSSILCRRCLALIRELEWTPSMRHEFVND